MTVSVRKYLFVLPTPCDCVCYREQVQSVLFYTQNWSLARPAPSREHSPSTRLSPAKGNATIVESPIICRGGLQCAHVLSCLAGSGVAASLGLQPPEGPVVCVDSPV